MSSKVTGFLVGCVVVLLTLAGAALYVLHLPATDHAVGLVPERARVYVHVFLKPSTQQRLALESLLEDTLDRDDAADDVRDVLEGLIRPLLQERDLTYDRGVRPWLGTELALFVLDDPTEQAIMIATKDPGRSLEVGRTLLGDRDDLTAAVVEGFLVLGTPGAVAATGEGDGLSLGADAEVAATLPEHRIVTVYLAPEPFAAALSVRSDAVTADVLAPGAAGLEAVAERVAAADLLPLALAGSLLSSVPDLLDPRASTALRLAGALTTSPSEEHDRILGDGYSASTVVDLAALARLGELTGLLDSQTGPRGPGWIRRLDDIVIGSLPGDDSSLRIVIGVK